MASPPANPSALPALLIGNREPLMAPLRKWLDTGGYSASTSRSGREGLARARRDLPALIVADIEQPDMTIVELCHLLRADALASPGTPVLVVSRDEVNRERRLAVLRAGAWDCLVWPWDPEAVLLRVRSYAQGKMGLERARAEGLVDPSTGLYNSRGLQRRAREMGSHAFRTHGSLACVTVSIDLDPNAPSVPVRELAPPVAVALQASARPSDPTGRLSATEFAVFAAGADEGGAQSLAIRLRRAVEGAVELAGLAAGTYRVETAFHAVANLTYEPIEATDLLARATAALRVARSDPPSPPHRTNT